MSQASRKTAQADESLYPRAHRLMRGMAWLYGGAVLVVLLWLALGFLPAATAPELRAMAREWIVGGLGAIVLPALLVAFTASLATLALTGARFRYSTAPDVPRAHTPTRWQYWSITNPGVAARQGQAVIVTTGAVLAWVAERLLWPVDVAPSAQVVANVGAAFAFLLAFLSLVAERVVNEFPEPQLPEAPKVRRLLLFATLVLTAAACLEIARGAGVAWARWVAWLLICLPGLVALELALRALARMFLPPPRPADATAVTDSLLAALITGGPRAPGVLLKTHFGLDFSRSWALAFLSSAALPALFGTGLLCWGLTGVKLIDLGQRGVYERFGAPVGVLGPGLHLLLPWPFGRLRPVEFGTIHSAAIGVDEAESDQSMLADAEAPPPLSLNRLWETAHAGQAHYLVPSTGTGPQGFQSIATEISVLYRVGLTDNAALQSVYSIADPDSLIKEEAGRLVLRYFNSRTLETVIGARRENVAGALQRQLATNIDAHHAGLEIVSVLIEEIHPPAGAAAAYHAVQAAEINATASIFAEDARAKRTLGVAQQEAHQMTTSADAKAAEIRRLADAAAYRFSAERRAYAAGGKAFLLERYYGKFDAALSKVPVTIMDHRLSTAAGDGALIDLRSATPTVGAPPGREGAPAAAPTPAPAAGATPPRVP